jgi:hypothetical protein
LLFILLAILENRSPLKKPIDTGVLFISYAECYRFHFIGIRESNKQAAIDPKLKRFFNKKTALFE